MYVFVIALLEFMQLFDNIGEVVFTFVLKTLGTWHIEQRFVGQIFCLTHLYRIIHIMVSVTSTTINYNIYLKYGKSTNTFNKDKVVSVLMLRIKRIDIF